MSGNVKGLVQLPGRGSVAVEALESRVCLSDAAGGFHFHAHFFHHVHRGAPPLPTNGSYSVMSFGKMGERSSGQGERFEQHGAWSNGAVRFNGEASTDKTAGPSGPHYGFPTFTKRMERGIIAGHLIFISLPLPPNGADFPVGPPDGTNIGNDPSTGSDRSGGVGEAAKPGAPMPVRGSHVDVSPAGGKIASANGRSIAQSEALAVNIPPAVVPIPSVTSNRQVLAEVVDSAEVRSASRSASSVLVSGQSNAFAALASAAVNFGGSIMGSVLPQFHFTWPTPADFAANLQDAAAQAVQRVVVTSQPAIEFAHLGSPFTLVADSMAAFIEDSASIPAVAAQARSQGPWSLTVGVLVADLIVLTYMHRRSLKLQRRLIPQLA